MNFPLFIANRIAKNQSGSFSSTIHRIAVISIGLSLAVLIVSFFVLYGFKDAIKDKVYHLSGHLTVNKYSLSTSYEETFIETSDSLLSGLRGHEEISHVQEFILKAGLIKTEEEVQGIIMKGVGSDFDTASFQSQMITGSFPDYSKDGYSNEVVISHFIANMLNLKIGDRVTLFFLQEPPRFRRITVSGIYTTGMEEFDEQIIYGDIDLIRRINGWEENQSGGLEIILKDHQKIDEMEDELFDSLPIDLNVTSANRQHPQIFEWLQMLNRNVLILLVIIIIVAALGMVSMILILIMERTNMIGVMKSFGADNEQLRIVFLYSGLSLVVRGLILGNGVALLLCWLQQEFELVPLDVANYYMNVVPITFDIPTLIVLNVSMIFLVGLTLLIPIQVVGSVKPIQAIRFD